MPEQPDYLKDFELSPGPVDRRRRHGDTPPNDVLPSELSARAYDHMSPPFGPSYNPHFGLASAPRPWVTWLSLVSSIFTLMTVVYLAGRQSVPVAPTDRSGARPASAVPVSRGGERAVGEEWQYLVVEYPLDYPKVKGGGLQTWLNGYGAQGWEHVSGSAYLSRHMFKRRVAKL